MNRPRNATAPTHERRGGKVLRTVCRRFYSLLRWIGDHVEQLFLGYMAVAAVVIVLIMSGALS